MNVFPTNTSTTVAFIILGLVTINIRTKIRIYSARVRILDEWCDAMVKAVPTIGDGAIDADREANNWRNLLHPNIIQLYAYCQYHYYSFLFMEKGVPLPL
jgi:serine/threonine protein kinase